MTKIIQLIFFEHDKSRVAIIWGQGKYSDGVGSRYCLWSFSYLEMNDPNSPFNQPTKKLCAFARGVQALNGTLALCIYYAT